MFFCKGVQARTCRNSRTAASSAPASPSGSSTAPRVASGVHSLAQHALNSVAQGARMPPRTTCRCYYPASAAAHTCIGHVGRPGQPAARPLGARSSARRRLVHRRAARLLPQGGDRRWIVRFVRLAQGGGAHYHKAAAGKPMPDMPTHSPAQPSPSPHTGISAARGGSCSSGTSSFSASSAAALRF